MDRCVEIPFCLFSVFIYIIPALKNPSFFFRVFRFDSFTSAFHRLFLRNLFPSVSIKCHLMISGQDHFHSHFCAVSDRKCQIKGPCISCLFHLADMLQLLFRDRQSGAVVFLFSQKHRDFHLSAVRRLKSEDLLLSHRTPVSVA